MKVVIAAVLTALVIGLAGMIDVDLKNVKCNNSISDCVREYRIAYYDYQIRSYRKKYWDLVGEKYVGEYKTPEEKFWEGSVIK